MFEKYRSNRGAGKSEPRIRHERWIELPDSCKPLPQSMRDGIDPQATMREWQRLTEEGEFIMPSEPGYEEAQAQKAQRNRHTQEFLERFGITALNGIVEET